MTKAAVVILAGTERHENLGRLANGLETAKEFAQTEGDELELIFDGAGMQWILELEDEESNYHELYQAVRDDASACDFCSGAFGVEEAVADAGIVTLDDHDGHPSILVFIGVLVSALGLSFVLELTSELLPMLFLPTIIFQAGGRP